MKMKTRTGKPKKSIEKKLRERKREEKQEKITAKTERTRVIKPKIPEETSNKKAITSEKTREFRLRQYEEE